MRGKQRIILLNNYPNLPNVSPKVYRASKKNVSTCTMLNQKCRIKACGRHSIRLAFDLKIQAIKILK